MRNATITRRTIRSSAHDVGNAVPDAALGTDANMRVAIEATLIAWEMFDRGEVERDEVPDIAGSIMERVRTQATRDARSAHTWFRNGETRGDTDTSLRSVPDGYTRVKAETKPERSNTGTTINRVTRHGRGYVGGATRADHTPALSMSPAYLQHALETVPRTAMGHSDAISLTRLAAVAYPDLPRLIGGDVITYQEFGTWDAVLAASGYRARLRIGHAVPRAAESADLAPTELLAASHDPAYAWRGHRHVLRPTTARETRKMNARPIDQAFVIPAGEVLGDALAGLAASVTAPYRATWSYRGLSGAITVTGTDRVRIAVSGLSAARITVRTQRGLRDAVDRVTA